MFGFKPTALSHVVLLSAFFFHKDATWVSQSPRFPGVS